MQSFNIHSDIFSFHLFMINYANNISTLLNMLYNNDFSLSGMTGPAQTAYSSLPVTQVSSFYFAPSQGNMYCDTVGLGDPNLTNAQIISNLKRILQEAANGIHCVIVMVKWQRLTALDRENIFAINEMFDSRWKSQSILGV